MASSLIAREEIEMVQSIYALPWVTPGDGITYDWRRCLLLDGVLLDVAHMHVLAELVDQNF